MTGMVGLFRNWPLALGDRVHLLGGRPVVYALRNGAKLEAHANALDVRIINELWIDRLYAPFPEFAVRDGWVVLDAGAHIGIYTVLAATSAKNVRVYAFEPLPASYAMLSRNVGLNRLSNVRTFNVALGSEDGELSLHVARDSGRDSVFQRPDAVMTQTTVPIQAWSMEHALSVIDAPVNLLKMAIEGMEYDILRSCPEHALRKIERMAVLCHEKIVQGGASGLSGFLERHGFSVRLQPERRMLFAQRSGLR